MIAGATGYIGRSVVRESVRQGYDTVALVRDASKVPASVQDEFLEGARIVECDVTDLDSAKGHPGRDPQQRQQSRNDRCRGQLPGESLGGQKGRVPD